MKKSDQTKNDIKNAFISLLETQPVSSISVADIVKTAGVNRNTFYYHYHNIPDLLESVVRELVDDILVKHPPTYNSLEDCFLAAIGLARENHAIINNIYHSTSRAIFERHLWHICDYSISSFLESFQIAGIAPGTKEAAVLKDFLKFEAFGFAIDWVGRGMPGDVLEKARILSAMILREAKV